jgi:hypothetical protein
MADPDNAQRATKLVKAAIATHAVSMMRFFDPQAAKYLEKVAQRFDLRFG